MTIQRRTYAILISGILALLIIFFIIGSLPKSPLSKLNAAYDAALAECPGATTARAAYDAASDEWSAARDMLDAITSECGIIEPQR